MPQNSMAPSADVRASMEGGSRSIMRMNPQTPPIKNWMQLILTTSIKGANLSMTRMCREKLSAHAMTRLSPMVIVKLSSVMHRSQRPTRARTTATQMFRPLVRPRKIPRTGTITIYKLVRNPALPTVVYRSPNCCRDSEIKSIVPQINPANHNVLLRQGFAPGFLCIFPWTLSRIGITARRNSPPIMDLPHVKVKGLTCSMPRAWATKLEPQILAVINSRKELRSCKDMINRRRLQKLNIVKAANFEHNMQNTSEIWHLRKSAS